MMQNNPKDKYSLIGKKIYAIIVISIVIVCGVYIYNMFKQPWNFGYDGSGFREFESKRLFDTLSNSFNYYYKINKRLPSKQGKCFFDQLKYYITDLSPYIYIDTISLQGEIHDISLHSKQIYLLSSNTYIGVGRGEHYIVYRKTSGINYILYYIGENLKDEYGNGDDILYEGEIDTRQIQ